MEEDRLLSIQEVALRIGSHATSVRHWVRTGRIPAVRLGHVYRVRTSDVDQILSSGIPARAKNA